MTNSARLRRCGGALFSVIALLSGCSPADKQTRPSTEGSLLPLATGDLDEDGLSDDEEEHLARRFAPIVVLHRRDKYRPASIPWLLRVASESGAPSRIPKHARRGSTDRSDWTAYVHVYPRSDGGINLQYWFFYPYNDGPLFFDHDSDWEHVTVRLDAERVPMGAYLARHTDDHPGKYFAWARLMKSGDHPVVFSAKGSHATYANLRDVPWYDKVASCKDLSTCLDPIWVTGDGPLPNIGERGRPLVLSEILSYQGRWGRVQPLPGTSAPFGPLHHRGMCSHGFRSCFQRDERPLIAAP